jgi:hypothetical protein
MLGRFHRCGAAARILSVGAALTLLTWLPCATRAQQVFRCVGAGGQVVFQQFECAGAERVSVRPINVAQPFQPDADLERSARVRDAISRGAILAGMTADEVHQVLGLPQRASRTAGVSGTRDLLVYRYPDGSTRYVHLRDELVDAVTDFSGPPRQPLEPCYSPLEIRNAAVGAQSAVLPPEERDRRQRESERMARCRR